MLLDCLHSEENREKPLVHAVVVENEDDASKDGVEGSKETTDVPQEVEEGVRCPSVPIQIYIHVDVDLG